MAIDAFMKLVDHTQRLLRVSGERAEDGMGVNIGLAPSVGAFVRESGGESMASLGPVSVEQRDGSGANSSQNTSTSRCVFRDVVCYYCKTLQPHGLTQPICSHCGAPWSVMPKVLT